MDRRQFFTSGGLVLAGLSCPGQVFARNSVVHIDLRSDVEGANVWFDPIGVLVEPGTSIRWQIRENVHTVTAYHPDNENHSLRIPLGAKPWDSGYLVNPGDQFKVMLSVPGVYDYYCAPHEHGGMVGRIIVGSPTGPGSKKFDYFQSLSPAPDWNSVPEEARENFPSITQIIQEKIVRVKPV